MVPLEAFEQGAIGLPCWNDASGFWDETGVEEGKDRTQSRDDGAEAISHVGDISGSDLDGQQR